MTLLKSRAVSAAVVACAAVAFSGCTVKKTEVPGLAGPSETGLSLRTTITPDILDQNGIAQSVVEMVARGPDGRPMASVPLRVEIRVGNQIVDFGRLSNRQVVTGGDGIARVTYTAPPRPPEPVDTYTVVTLVVTPIGGDFAGSVERFVEVRVVPEGVIIPPNGAPTFPPPPDVFVITPTPVTTITPVTFDASGTRDEGVICGTRCSYAWNFGDGSSGTGMIVSHEFRNPGTYTVRLTATDVRGLSNTTSRQVTVEATAAPTADFVFSPSAPVASQDIFFNAQGSRAAPGHTIVTYEWDFGSGRTGSGVTVSKRYDTPGTYNVTLRVDDDTFTPAGTAVVTKPVTVTP